MNRFVIVTRNRPGVLARVTALVHRFNANIESLRTEPLSGTNLSLIDLTLDDPAPKADILRDRIDGLIDVQHLVRVPVDEDGSRMEPTAG